MFRNQTMPPDFTLFDADSKQRSLAGLRDGKPLVIFFFRGAFCLTTRKDLMLYNDVYSRIQQLGANLVAISVDTPDELRRLRHYLTLEFPLLSDADFAVSEKYGIYRSDETDEGPQPHGEPAVYVLDVDGKIAYSQIQSGPKGHANPSEIILMLIYMQQNGGRYW